MSAQREAFEKWADKWSNVEAKAVGDYEDDQMHALWSAWQAAQAAMQADPDAARYRWLRRGTRGVRVSSRVLAKFDMPCAPPVGDIMQGSIAQHLDAAIDAEISRTGSAA